MTEPILQVRNLSVSFPGKQVLNQVGFTLNRGRFLCILGENGVGKTTLIRVILNQLKPASGSVRFFPSRRAVRIGYVPQFRNIDADYPLSIKDFVSLNLAKFKWPWLTRKERASVHQLLIKTNLDKIRNRPLGKASGGEKQRAYLAQSLLDQPNLLILDESTASLDPVAKVELLDVVKWLNQSEQLSVIFITHDVPLARKYADDYLLLTPGHYQFGEIGELENPNLWGKRQHA
ncbi:metal ABC transporter ATP-binding protein [Lentilactobacillus raoultii]|uniref:Metal ABC transporter ATP-binding protein n=1 Tax=Lentilactobacillus raoultii TaxID=1987503 RepID=A0ABW3PGK6_9LACO|nr:ATP-binding cassette domain-containing protein [Lentilactobacillus raoultii]